MDGRFVPVVRFRAMFWLQDGLWECDLPTLQNARIPLTLRPEHDVQAPDLLKYSPALAIL